MMDGPGGARDPRFGNPYGMGLESPDMYGGGGSLRASTAGLQACSGLPRGLKRPGSEACYDDRPVSSQGHGLEHCPLPDIADDGYASLQPKKSPPSNGKKTKGRVKIKMEYIDNKLRRYTTFSKRKTGIMKKAYELSTLTGTQVMLLVASETGHVYTFATRKLQPMITSDSGKRLIQTCLNSPDPPSGAPVGDQRMSATGFEETELTYNIVDDDIKVLVQAERSPMSSGESCDDSGSEPEEAPSDKSGPRGGGGPAARAWCESASPPRADSRRETAVSTSSEEASQMQYSSRSKDLKSHGLPAALASLVPGLGLPGGPGSYCPMPGLDGLGTNLGLGNLPMGYPHGIILGLANQNSDGASSSQPQFITIPLSMAMAAAAATATQATAGGGAAVTSPTDELQDLSTTGRK